MKSINKKYCLSVILLLISIVFLNPDSVRADHKQLYVSDGWESAVAGTAVSHTINFPYPGNIRFTVITKQDVDFSLNFDEKDGDFAFLHTKRSSMDKLSENGEYKYTCPHYIDFETIDDFFPMDFTVSLTAKENTDFQLIVAFDEEPKITHGEILLGKGIQKNLRVFYHSGDVIWKSSNPKVASVDGNGKVTAKSTGTCTIIAAVDGTELTCKVNVVENKYVSDKFTNYSFNARASCVLYEASFDSKGNLIVKCRVANNSGWMLTGFSDFKIYMRVAYDRLDPHDLSQDHCVIYKKDFQPVYISPQKAEILKIKIKKSALQKYHFDAETLKKKNIDLVNASVLSRYSKYHLYSS